MKIKTPMEGPETVVVSDIFVVAVALAMMMFMVLGTMVVYQHSQAIEALYKQVESLTTAVNKDASSVKRYEERTEKVMEVVTSYQSEVEKLSKFFPDRGGESHEAVAKEGVGTAPAVGGVGH